ncbi:MAG: NusG domain II-containing protein [Lachnospiraceae bacterium]|nr:NusG domain II-containing protein [Lachnospiraceae bacterium]MDE7274761.1 NusG domain II-containing protein [Lachnospiraceae bacterium]
MFRKKDFVLIGFIVVIAAVSALFTMFVQRNAGTTVCITIDGVFYGAYSLSEDQSISIDGEFGHNRLVIEDGSAYMADADCPDKYCMDYKPVSKGGETIICLPHKLVVEVTGTREAQQPDVIVP